jgi:hypothetical protein
MTMKHRILRLISVLALLAAGPLCAQPPKGTGAQPPAPTREVPRPDQLEPGVDTSATPASHDAAEQTKTPTAQPTSEPRAPRDEKSGANQSTAKAAEQPSSPNANTARNSTDAQTASRGKTSADKAHDSIQLDTTDITGNRELPKVLYIVPWKRSDLGDLIGKPANSLLDEVLSPVDRDVFKRENRYYDALKPDAGGTPGSAATATPAAGAAPESGGKP